MKVVKIEPVSPAVNMTWMLGSRCNYSCSYCPSELHDATSRHADLDTMILAWKNFYSKTQHLQLPYKISFTGGEVTANRNFLPLVKHLRDNYSIGQIVVTTNGSASTDYYLKLADLVDAISFSVHSEFWDESRFFQTVIAVNAIMTRPAKSCHVNIMDESWNRSNFPRYQALLGAHNISHSINVIHDTTSKL